MSELGTYTTCDFCGERHNSGTHSCKAMQKSFTRSPYLWVGSGPKYFTFIGEDGKSKTIEIKEPEEQ